MEYILQPSHHRRKRSRQLKNRLSFQESIFLVLFLLHPTAGFVNLFSNGNPSPTYRSAQTDKDCRLQGQVTFPRVSRALSSLFASVAPPSSSFPDASAWQQKPANERDANAFHSTYNGNYRPKRKKKQSEGYRIRQLFRRAKELERKGLWAKSASMLKDILEIDPSDSHSYLALARLEARRERSTQGNGNNLASEIFEKGTTACPDSIHLWQAWAVYEESRGDINRAKDLFEKALDLDPYNTYVCHAYGLMLKRSAEASGGNTRQASYSPEARVLWERALEKNTTAALVCSLGEMMIANKEFSKARNLYAQHVLKLDDEREKTEVYLAIAWLEERYFSNFDKAEKWIELALNESPTSSIAQVALARLKGRRQEREDQHHITQQKQRRERKKGDEAKSAMTRSLASACMNLENESTDRQPKDGRVYNAWANLEAKANRLSEARRILTRGMARYPNDHSLLQAAGKMEERLGNYTGARELYSSSLLVEPSAPALVAYALLELRQPQKDGVSFDFEHIQRLFEEALLLDPRHGPAYNAYARCVFQKQKDEDKARAIYERGLRANCSDVASIYHGYALLELSLGNVNRARELLVEGTKQVRRIDVGRDTPLRERAVFLTHTLGMLELNSNKASVALEVFLDGIDRYGNSSQLWLGAALCEMKIGNERMAREFFERSVLYDGKHAQAWQAWGVMEMRAGNFETAETLFGYGLKIAPKHGALWQAYAIMQSRMGNTENARALFETGIRKAPKHVSLYQSWASMELRENNLSAAKALITQALTLDKRNGAGWLIAAEIEKQAGNAGLENLLLRRGIECSPTDANLYCALGETLLRQGKIDEAREVMEQGIEVDPMHAPLYHSLAELEAKIFNLEGLNKLHKKASKIFNANAMEPSNAASEILESKIKAGRSRSIPKGITALAQRIVEEETESNDVESDPDTFLDEIINSSDLLEDGLVGDMKETQKKKSHLGE